MRAGDLGMRIVFPPFLGIDKNIRVGFSEFCFEKAIYKKFQMESCLSNLQEDVQCSLCEQTLTEPKLLQCFHTICKSCILRHAQLKEQVHIFECPKCSSETLLQDLSNDVEHLQPSPLHTRMLQVLAFAESEKSCSVSATHSPALWYCFDCDRSLCDECLKNHSTFIENHQVLSFSDFKKEHLGSMLRREKTCKIHLNHTFEFFCKNCDVLMCSICLKDDHNSHKILTLQEVTAIEKDSLSTNLEEIDMLRCNEIQKKQQEEIAIKMKSDGEKAKNDVQKFTKKLVKSLLDQEQQLLNQIESSVAKADRNLRIIRHIPAAQEYIRNILDNGIASDMVDGSKSFVFSPYKSDTSGMVFYPNEDWSQQVVNGQLGNIKLTFKSHPDLSTIEVDQSSLHALTKAKFFILTKYRTGEINYDDSEDVDIQIRPVNDVKVEEKTVKTDGKIEVQFTPQVRCYLTAEVQLNGIPVSNSPLVMNVKPQHIEESDEESKLKTALNIKSRNTAGIAVNKTNNRIAVADIGSHCVRVFTMDGELLLMYGGRGSELGQLLNPQGLAFLNDIDLVIVDGNNNRICIVNTTTETLVRTFGRHGNGNGEFANPSGVHVDDDSNIVVSDSHNGRVQVFTKDGDYRYQFTVSNQNFIPVSTVTHNGLFYVNDYSIAGVIHVIQMKDGSQTRVSTIGEKGYAAGQFMIPCSLAIDNDHNLLLCDSNNQLVSKFTLDGRFIGQSSKLQLQPRYIAVLNNGQFICTCNDGRILFFRNNNS